MTLLATALLAVASLAPADPAIETPDCAALEPCLAWFDANAARIDGEGERLCELARENLPRFAQSARKPLFARLDAAPAIRGYAACALAGFGVPLLRAVFDDMVEHEKNEVRWTAAQDVIRRIGAEAAGMTAAWQRIATDVQESPAPRIAALRALEALGPQAAAARTSLDALANDEDPEIREAARRTLAAIGGEGAPGTP
ncbi:MAG TPA: hypothetical protein VM555_04385 [Tahibacter sp.]|nr:hypothetical protein [Tahibacter sp.]